MKSPSHIFSKKEVALAYATCAERILSNDSNFLENNPAIIPIFVNNLYQSLEISIKYIGISANLLTIKDVRSKQVWNGHGIEELVNLAIESTHVKSNESFMKAFNFHEKGDLHRLVINEMVFGKGFANTRKNYATRNLGYGEVCDGDFSIVSDLGVWVEAVKNVALNSDLSIQQLLILEIQTVKS